MGNSQVGREFALQYTLLGLIPSTAIWSPEPVRSDPWVQQELNPEHTYVWTPKNKVRPIWDWPLTPIKTKQSKRKANTTLFLQVWGTSLPIALTPGQDQYSILTLTLMVTCPFLALFIFQGSKAKSASGINGWFRCYAYSGYFSAIFCPKERSKPIWNIAEVHLLNTLSPRFSIT